MITAELRIPITLSKCQNLGELSYIYNSKQEILDITLLRSVIFISMFSISALMVNEKHFRGAVKTFGLIENYWNYWKSTHPVRGLSLWLC